MHTVYWSSFMKHNGSIVYAISIENVETLRFRIEQASQQIREIPVSRKHSDVSGSVTRRLQACFEMRVGQFEYSL